MARSNISSLLQKAHNFIERLSQVRTRTVLKDANNKEDTQSGHKCVGEDTVHTPTVGHADAGILGPTACILT